MIYSIPNFAAYLTIKNIIKAIIMKLIKFATKFPIPNTPIFQSWIVSKSGMNIPIIGVIMSSANDKISALIARPIMNAEASPSIL